jgi:hypothetical protein
MSDRKSLYEKVNESDHKLTKNYSVSCHDFNNKFKHIYTYPSKQTVNNWANDPIISK